MNNRKPEKQHHIKLFILERFLYCKPWDNISHTIFSDNTSEKEFILCTVLIIETATWQVRKVEREGQNLAFPSPPHSCTITPWSGCKCQIVVYRRLQKWSDPLMRQFEGAWWGPGYVFFLFYLFLSILALQCNHAVFVLCHKFLIKNTKVFLIHGMCGH